MSALLIDDDHGVRAVTLHRPDRLNALDLGAYEELAAVLAAAAADDGVRVVHLRGAGRGFCSGADLRAFAETDTADLQAAFEALVTGLAAFPKPLLAEVHGVAVGIGFTMLLHCDLVLVSDDARLRAPFVNLGTAPEAASSWLLPQVVGAQRAADLMLTARWVSGPEAVDLGLAARCLPPTELPAAAAGLARQVADLPAAAVSAAKRLLREGRAEGVRLAVARESAAAAQLFGELGFGR